MQQIYCTAPQPVLTNVKFGNRTKKFLPQKNKKIKFFSPTILSRNVIRVFSKVSIYCLHRTRQLRFNRSTNTIWNFDKYILLLKQIHFDMYKKVKCCKFMGCTAHVNWYQPLHMHCIICTSTSHKTNCFISYLRNKLLIKGLKYILLLFLNTYKCHFKSELNEAWLTACRIEWNKRVTLIRCLTLLHYTPGYH